MKNLFRLLGGLILAPIVFVAILFLFTISLPILFVFQILFAFVLTLFIVFAFFAFIYYFTRKEPVVKKTSHSNNFSIESGKRR